MKLKIVAGGEKNAKQIKIIPQSCFGVYYNLISFTIKQASVHYLNRKAVVAHSVERWTCD